MLISPQSHNIIYSFNSIYCSCKNEHCRRWKQVSGIYIQYLMQLLIISCIILCINPIPLGLHWFSAKFMPRRKGKQQFLLVENRVNNTSRVNDFFVLLLSLMIESVKDIYKSSVLVGSSSLNIKLEQIRLQYFQIWTIAYQESDREQEFALAFF